MGVADSERECIGGIFRRRQYGETKLRCNHLLYTQLIYGSRPRYSLLCSFRGVLKYLDSLTRGCEIHHAFSHSQFERALNIFQDKLRFSRNKIGSSLR